MGFKRLGGWDSVRFEASSSELRKTEQSEVNPTLTVFFIINELRELSRLCGNFSGNKANQVA